MSYVLQVQDEAIHDRAVHPQLRVSGAYIGPV
jgi:hypothetical protein